MDKRMHNDKGRLWPSKKDTYSFEGNVYEIRPQKEGIYTRILRAILEVLKQAETSWRRVCLMRLDLRLGDVYFDDNSIISKFWKNLRRVIIRKYGFEPLFAWVRECKSNLHYHVLLYLDGGRVRYWTKIQEIAKRAWEKFNPQFNIPSIPKPFYRLTNDETKRDAIYRISYMAKADSKGIRALTANDFGASRGRL